MENKTTFAIGCLVQWYEVEVFEEYFNTMYKAIQAYDGKVIIDITLVMNQQLEQVDHVPRLEEIKRRIVNKIDTIRSKTFPNNPVFRWFNHIHTIADYRRQFNDRYCDQVDVLVWGETDMLVPKDMFVVLNQLHKAIGEKTPKYLATFGICKMWDNSWKPLEHPKFTDKPFIENDYDNWWSVKYTMTESEQIKFNKDVHNIQLTHISPHKYNGCGLVISSEVIKAGVNIPKSVFFVHEDTSFMLMVNKILPNIPQYHFSNILLVHNRNHPKKRMYVKNETGDTLNKQRRSNEWYVKANKYSEENCYNLFNPNHKSKTWEDVWK